MGGSVLEEQEVMNSGETAAFLRVNRDTVIREARAGRLPGRRIGKEWRFSRTALLEWLARGPDDEDRGRYKRNGLRAVQGNEAQGQGV